MSIGIIGNSHGSYYTQVSNDSGSNKNRRQLDFYENLVQVYDISLYDINA